MDLYVDGVWRASETENFGAIDDGGLPLRIGISSEGLHPFSGLIDEVAIFARALSADDIKAIYDAGSVGMARPLPRILFISDRDGDFEIYTIAAWRRLDAAHRERSI